VDPVGEFWTVNFACSYQPAKTPIAVLFHRLPYHSIIPGLFNDNAIEQAGMLATFLAPD